jgi:hypothetical protein
MAEELTEMWGNFKLLEEENIGVSIDNVELDPLLSRGQACIVGKILADRVVPMEFFKKPLIRVWQPLGTVSFRSLGENMFIADFEQEVDKVRILEGRPWLFDGNLVSLADFDGTTPPSQMEFERASFWLRMYNLPLACMSKEIGQKIGASVGVVEDVDVLDGEAGWGEFLRVRISLDLAKPLARGRLLHLQGKSIWVAFKFEKIPKFCFSCGVIRHGKLGCRKMSNHRTSGIEMEYPYGQWLRVSYPSRRGGSDERFGRGTSFRSFKGSSSSAEGGAEHHAKGGLFFGERGGGHGSRNPNFPSVKAVSPNLENCLPLRDGHNEGDLPPQRQNVTPGISTAIYGDSRDACSAQALAGSTASKLASIGEIEGCTVMQEGM